MVKYILQRYDILYEDWVDTNSSWNPTCYDEYRFHEMLESNLNYAKKVYPWAKFRIIKRDIIEEVIL